MPSTVSRRPWPALVALLALLLLTGLVWWRVLHRNTGGGTPQAGGTSTCTAGPTPSPTLSPSASGVGASPASSGSATPAKLPPPSAVTVAVLNATTRQGLAGKAQSVLVKDGFTSPQAAGNDTAHLNKIKGVAEIRFGPKGRRGAKLLHYYLPGATLVHTHSKRATVTVSLGDKFHHVASQKRVRRAMAADAVSTATSSAPPSSSSPC